MNERFKNAMLAGKVRPRLAGTAIQVTRQLQLHSLYPSPRTSSTMSTYLYELPTTGAISFSNFCVDQTASYNAAIADATQARANLRAALKESKRTDGEKDYLRLVKVLYDLSQILVDDGVEATQRLSMTTYPISSD